MIQYRHVTYAGAGVETYVGTTYAIVARLILPTALRQRATTAGTSSYLVLLAATGERKNASADIYMVGRVGSMWITSRGDVLSGHEQFLTLCRRNESY